MSAQNGIFNLKNPLLNIKRSTLNNSYEIKLTISSTAKEYAVKVEGRRPTWANVVKIDTDNIDVQVTNGEVNVDVNEQSGFVGKLIKFLLRRKK